MAKDKWREKRKEESKEECMDGWHQQKRNSPRLSGLVCKGKLLVAALEKAGALVVGTRHHLQQRHVTLKGVI